MNKNTFKSYRSKCILEYMINDGIPTGDIADMFRTSRQNLDHHIRKCNCTLNTYTAFKAHTS